MSIRTIIALLILGGAFIAINYNKKQVVAPTPDDGVVACTMDAKECPDGSFVGRTGPNCEFICPDIKKPDPVKPLSTTGMVKGRVVVSPTCGNIPVDGSCPPGPYKTSILFFTNSSRYTAYSNEDGYYSIDLPAGSYKVQAQGGEIYPQCEIQETVVNKDKTTTLNITCDSGIL